MGAFTGIVDFSGKHCAAFDASLMMAEIACRGTDEKAAQSGCAVMCARSGMAMADVPALVESNGSLCACTGEWVCGGGHDRAFGAGAAELMSLFTRFGADFPKHARGQFALSVWDGEKLYLARDGLGAEPLFYTRRGSRVWFASEIKALLAIDEIRAARGVEMKALDQLLTWPGPLAPHTFFKNIWSLRAGETVIISRDGENKSLFTDLDFPKLDSDILKNAGKSPEPYVEELERLFLKAVEKRMTGDSAFFLSGGLDSSTVVCAAAALGAKDQTAFSVSFSDVALDESKWQDLVIKKTGCRSVRRQLTTADILDRTREVIRLAETPLKESYNACSLILSSMLRAEGYNAVLSGEGADEFFAGYAGYLLDIGEREEDEDSLAADIEKQMRRKLWGDENLLYERNYSEHEELRRSLYSADVAADFDSFNATAESPIDKKMIDGRHHFHKRSYLDNKLRVPDHELSDHGDRVLMANGISGRYPFLDADMLDFYLKIPPQFLAWDGKEKYPVRMFAQKYVPHEITDRRKFSFVAQGSPDLLKQGAPWVDELLSDEYVKKAGYFDPAVIKRLKKQYSKGSFRINQTFEEDLLMTILTFHIWLEEFDMPKLG